MDDENKPEQESSEPSHQHVRIFGAEVNGGGGDSGTTNDGAPKTSSGADSQSKSETKEDWRARKQEWKAQHRAQMEQNRAQRQAQRDEWRQARHHEGGMFWGLVLLLVGVLALLGTMGYLSSAFWQAIVPFWPILLILWGASLVLGRHWFARFIIFIFALIFLIMVILYGLIRTSSPLVSSLSPNVVRAVQTTQPQQY